MFLSPAGPIEGPINPVQHSGHRALRRRIEQVLGVVIN